MQLFDLFLQDHHLFLGTLRRILRSFDLGLALTDLRFGKIRFGLETGRTLEVSR